MIKEAPYGVEGQPPLAQGLAQEYDFRTTYGAKGAQKELRGPKGSFHGHQCNPLAGMQLLCINQKSQFQTLSQFRDGGWLEPDIQKV